jgi:FkbM family methyltransferase
MSLLSNLQFIANHPLNKRRKVGALIGFVKWQIGSRLIPGRVMYDWVNGSKLIVRSGETGLTGNVYCGLHEFPEMAYLLHVLEPLDVFVDIGANVGSYTVLACAAKGASGYCFEPVPETFERLTENLRANDLLDRVHAFNIGLSDKEGELQFTIGENCENHVVNGSQSLADTVKVKVSSLDVILNGDAPSVMKVDVEGFETPVLAGAHAALSNESLHSVILELNGAGFRYGYSEEKILETMAGYGFSAYAYEPFSRTLKVLSGKNRLSGNTIFVRGINAVLDKIRKTPQQLVGHVWL